MNKIMLELGECAIAQGYCDYYNFDGMGPLPYITLEIFLKLKRIELEEYE